MNFGFLGRDCSASLHWRKKRFERVREQTLARMMPVLIR